MTQRHFLRSLIIIISFLFCLLLLKKKAMLGRKSREIYKCWRCWRGKSRGEGGGSFSLGVWGENVSYRRRFISKGRRDIIGRPYPYLNWFLSGQPLAVGFLFGFDVYDVGYLVPRCASIYWRIFSSCCFVSLLIERFLDRPWFCVTNIGVPRPARLDADVSFLFIFSFSRCVILNEMNHREMNHDWIYWMMDCVYSFPSLTIVVILATAPSACSAVPPPSSSSSAFFFKRKFRKSLWMSMRDLLSGIPPVPQLPVPKYK